MLAEQFLLFLEALKRFHVESSTRYPDGGPRVVSTSPHIPVKAPGGK